MKRRTNITVEESLYAKAQVMMEVRDFSDFSGFLEQLIREEWERRNGPASVPSGASRPGSSPRGRGEAPAAGSGQAARAAGELPPAGPVSSAEVLRVAEASIPAAVEAARQLQESPRKRAADGPTSRKHRQAPGASQGA